MSRYNIEIVIESDPTHPHPEDLRRTEYDACSRAQAVIDSFGDPKFKAVLDQLLSGWVDRAPGPRYFLHPVLCAGVQS